MAKKPVSQAGLHDVRVHIGRDSAGKIYVDPDPFWIYRHENEQVKWVCVQHHPHGNAKHPCFKVHFAGSPFDMKQLDGHALSGRRTSTAKDNRKYKYTVTVDQYHLDPEGGVKP